MIVKLAAGRIMLAEPEDFRKFKVVVNGPRAEGEAESGGVEAALRFENADTAWVKISALKAVSGRAGDAAWLVSLQKMIDGARPHGWISADGTEIRAHVEMA